MSRPFPLGRACVGSKPPSGREMAGTVAGSLCLTERSLIFTPAKPGPRRNEQQNFPLQDCARVESVARTWTLYDGGLRRRMRVVRSDGSSAMFITRNVDDAIALLSGAIAEHARG
jgi:hypothetical protein